MYHTHTRSLTSSELNRMIVGLPCDPDAGGLAVPLTVVFTGAVWKISVYNIILEKYIYIQVVFI